MNLSSYISRWIAFGGASLAALAATFLANEAQILFHLHLGEGTLVGYLAPFLIGTFGLAWKWLEGRAKQEAVALEGEVANTFHLSPEIVAAIEKAIEQRLPEVPAAPLRR